MDSDKPTILVVDDDISVCESIKMVLKNDYKILISNTGEHALQTISDQHPDLILLDILLPEMDGLKVLKSIREHDSDIVVIMITATKTVKTAVTAMKLGAADYITKPFEVDEIRIIIQNAIESKNLKFEIKMLRRELEEKYHFNQIVGKSKPMREIFKTIQQIAPKNTTVLILGESGTGKELIAKAIHYTSNRKHKPFVAINCVAMPETLLESELFGIEKGVATGVDQRPGKFELADGGTIFLDEVGDMSLAMQAKLLRVLQEKEIVRVGGRNTIKVDVRLITATNKELESALKSGSIRPDLYYRINVVPIYLPRLSARREDIPLLIDHFISKYCRNQSETIRFSSEAHHYLMTYDWPGNVRELENVVERCSALAKENTIGVDDLPIEIVKSSQIKNQKNALFSGHITFDQAIEEIERDLIVSALDEANQVQTKAAKLLGITRRILKYKMDKFKIPGNSNQ
ncbi:MAG: hypothetical protein A2161_20975 [Candidatus Schekmanbacteria bacterium RBG_13_48_7]|uniref:Fis family transcriptional regulator n=1 Tax=Candidatus Schekmanbacteria bacterium RBG_13_48_7 TaxID=1817878 RepID=A0A1F7RQ85_9BACT|nr:MAG: hypothetical protein A2161_20975 [Candidatus Schekmanbacteria bacterium RBG_13_48_7]